MLVCRRVCVGEPDSSYFLRQISDLIQVNWGQKPHPRWFGSASKQWKQAYVRHYIYFYYLYFNIYPEVPNKCVRVWSSLRVSSRIISAGAFHSVSWFDTSLKSFRMSCTSCTKVHARSHTQTKPAHTHTYTCLEKPTCSHQALYLRWHHPGRMWSFTQPFIAPLIH